MSYEHDVFLSYPHRFEEWVLECFLPELEQYLSEELDPPTANILSTVPAFELGTLGANA